MKKIPKDFLSHAVPIFYTILFSVIFSIVFFLITVFLYIPNELNFWNVEEGDKKSTALEKKEINNHLESWVYIIGDKKIIAPNVRIEVLSNKEDASLFTPDLKTISKPKNSFEEGTASQNTKFSLASQDARANIIEGRNSDINVFFRADEDLKKYESSKEKSESRSALFQTIVGAGVSLAGAAVAIFLANSSINVSKQTYKIELMRDLKEIYRSSNEEMELFEQRFLKCRDISQDLFDKYWNFIIENEELLLSESEKIGQLYEGSKTINIKEFHGVEFLTLSLGMIKEYGPDVESLKEFYFLLGEIVLIFNRDRNVIKNSMQVSTSPIPINVGMDVKGRDARILARLYYDLNFILDFSGIDGKEKFEVLKTLGSVKEYLYNLFFLRLLSYCGKDVLRIFKNFEKLSFSRENAFLDCQKHIVNSGVLSRSENDTIMSVFREKNKNHRFINSIDDFKTTEYLFDRSYLKAWSFPGRNDIQKSPCDFFMDNNAVLNFQYGSAISKLITSTVDAYKGNYSIEVGEERYKKTSSFIVDLLNLSAVDFSFVIRKNKEGLVTTFAYQLYQNELTMAGKPIRFNSIVHADELINNSNFHFDEHLAGVYALQSYVGSVVKCLELNDWRYLFASDAQMPIYLNQEYSCTGFGLPITELVDNFLFIKIPEEKILAQRLFFVDLILRYAGYLGVLEEEFIAKFIEALKSRISNINYINDCL